MEGSRLTTTSKISQAECEADIVPTQELDASEADGDDTRGTVKALVVQPEHIAKVAAELLMDFT